MVRALTEYDMRGISTTIGFCRDLSARRRLPAAEFDTTYVDRLLEENGRARCGSDATGRGCGHCGGVVGDGSAPNGGRRRSDGEPVGIDRSPARRRADLRSTGNPLGANAPVSSR